MFKNDNNKFYFCKSRSTKVRPLLSGMIMPNIGAFIAWALITAFFIPTGWWPNERLSSLVGPMITYMLPLLIAYTGGKMVWGVRGGVVGAIATMGVIVGTDVPMFIGAMIMAPLGGWVIKKSDKLVEGKVPVGFEMLVDNFFSRNPRNASGAVRLLHHAAYPECNNCSSPGRSRFPGG